MGCQYCKPYHYLKILKILLIHKNVYLSFKTRINFYIAICILLL